MTHREYFNRLKRRFAVWFVLVGSAGLAIGAAGVVGGLDRLVLLAYLCIPLLFVVLYVAVIFGFRCRGCRGQWGWIAMYSGGPLAIRRGLRSCPYCGLDLDSAVAGSEHDSPKR